MTIFIITHSWKWYILSFSQQLYYWGWFFNLLLSDIAASDLSIQFKLRKRRFLLKILSRTIISQRNSRSINRVSSLLRFVFTKGIGICKPAIVKACEKDAKKLTMKNNWTKNNCLKWQKISWNTLKF